MNILIVGVGLIGGSFSLALQRKKELVFGGYDKDIGALKEAKELGVVSTTFNDLDEGIKWAELIVLATPVKSIKQLLPNVLDQLDGAQLVVDFGSTKSSICEMVHMHPRRSQFIAAHPIAGTEHSGPSAAFEGLYFGKNLILCDTELSDNKLLERFEELALVAGFSLIRMSSDDHDRHLAYISHLSHITSYALSNAVLKKEKDGEVILDLAGSGFESTVRLAKSSPEMWSSIFMENKAMVLKGIEAFKEELETMDQLIKTEAWDELGRYLEEGRVIRKILK